MTLVFLSLAVVFFSIQFLFSKGYQLKAGNGKTQSLVFTAMMSLGIILEFVVYQGFTLQISTPSLVYAFFYAVLILVCEIASLKAFEFGKVSIVSLYALVGSVVLPFFYGVILLKEPVGISKAAAILIICLSFLIPLFDDPSRTQEQTRPRKGLFTILCILVFLSNGLISIILKAHQMSRNIVSETNFLILASGFTLLLSIVLLIPVMINKGEGAKSPAGLNKKSIGLFVLLAFGYGTFNGTGNIFSMISARTLESSIQFPVISGGVVTLTALLSLLVYKEKITKKIGLSLGLAVLSIIIFSL